LEVAEATNKTGEVTVALFAGVETVTLTHAEANIGSEIRYAIKGDFQRIPRFSSGGPSAAAGDRIRKSAARQPGYFLLLVKVWVQRKKSNEGENPVTLIFLT
jgi:hypothetical protein